MNKELLMDAVSFISDDTMIDHFKTKELINSKKVQTKRPARAYLKLLPIAAALVVLAVLASAALSALLRPNDSYAYYYINDLPSTEVSEAMSANYWLSPSGPPKGYSKQNRKEVDLKVFFNNTEIPYISDKDTRTVIAAYINQSNKVYLIACSVYFPTGEEVNFTVENADLRALTQSIQTTSVGNYEATKSVYYALIRGDGTPIESSGTTDIILYGKDATIRITGSTTRPDVIEKMYNFLIDAEFDFDAFK